MTNQRLIELAQIGLNAEIEKTEKSIKKGLAYIEQIENGETVKTTKTKSEILAIVGAKRAKLEDLKKEKAQLSWEA